MLAVGGMLAIESETPQHKENRIRVECENITQAKDCSFDKGLIFIKEEDITLTTDKWTIVATIETDDFDAILGQIQALLSYLETQSGSNQSLPSIPLYELSRLRMKLQTTRKQVFNLKLLLPTKRTKRGLVNGLGTVLKFLFGTLDDDDYQTLNTKLERLDNTSNVLTHLQADRLTYVRKLTSEVDDNTKAIQLLVNAVKMTVTEVNNMTFSIWTEVQQLKRKLDYQAKLSSLFRSLELTLIEVDTKLVQLQEALDVTSTGFLSALLIPPPKLNSILREIVTELPVGLSLITTTDLDLTYHYYRVAKVHALAAKNVVRIIIDIPLQSYNSQFELYSVKSLPYYDKTIAQFVSVKSDYEYIALNVDRQSYAVISAVQEKQCVKQPFGICPLNVPIWRAAECHSCAYAMLIGNNNLVPQLCQRTIVRKLEVPVLHKGTSGEFWVYSIPQPTRITIRCVNGRNYLQATSTETRWLHGNGILLHPKDCQISSKYFTLMPRLAGKTSVSIQGNSIIVPQVKSILTPPETTLFSDYTNLTTINDPLISIETVLNQTGRANVIDIDLLQRKLNEIKTSSSRQETTSLSFIVFLIIIIAIMSVSFLVCGLQYPCVRRCIIPFADVTRAPLCSSRHRPERVSEGIQLSPVPNEEAHEGPTRFASVILPITT